MKKITLSLFGFLACSLFALAQFTFPIETGPILVAQGSPVTLNINDAANSAGIPITDYISFSVSADWEAVAGGPWSSEADLTVITSAGSVLIDPPTSGALSSGAATTLVFEGDFSSLYNPGVDGALDIVLNQSFSSSSANWSNVTVTILEAPTCFAPSAMSTSNLSTDAVDLSWTAGDTETSWDIEWKAGADFTPGIGEEDASDIVSGTPEYNASGLATYETYYVYYRADCGGGDTSDWVGPFVFTTYGDCSSTGTFSYLNNSTLASSLNSFVANDPADAITLTFTAGSTETCCDTWFINDAADGSGNTIASGNGSIVGSYESNTGEISFYVISDFSVIGTTFEYELSCAPACFADAGTLTADANPVELNGLTTISATPNGDIFVPADYEVIYVLTEGPTLVIQDVSTAAPSFDVTDAGDYTIHTLVAETSDSNDPNFLDLSVVQIGTTTGGDVLDIVTANDLCASLDVVGAPITVLECIADAGTLTADEDSVLLDGTVTISATPNGDIVVPTNYEVIYVLTEGATLVIQDVSVTSPSFEVTAGGEYTIHTLVAETSDNADPNFLDLSVVQIGVTTGGDVLDIINNNNLCASLDVVGAPVTVVDINAIDELLIVDLSTPNEVTIIATSGLSAATVSGSNNTGFYLADFFATAGTQALTGNSLVSGDLTSANEGSDNSPAIFRASTGADPGLNIWSYANVSTSTFTEGEVAFSGQATWTLPEAVYNAFLTAPDSGLIYFPADDVGDLPGASILGTYSVTTVPLSISDIETNAFTFYPNPVKNTLTLTAQNNIENVNIVNMLGQTVLRVAPNAIESEINMQTLANGTYFAQVTIAGVTKTIKVLKQ